MRKQILMAALLAATTLAAPAFALPDRADAGDDPRPGRVFNRDRGDDGGPRGGGQARVRPDSPSPVTVPEGGNRGGWQGRGEQGRQPDVTVAPASPPVMQSDNRRGPWGGGWNRDNAANGGWRGNRGGSEVRDENWQGRPRPPVPAPVAQGDPRGGGDGHGDHRRDDDRDHDRRDDHREDHRGGWNQQGNGAWSNHGWNNQGWNNRGWNNGTYGWGNNGWRDHERRYDNDSARWNRDWRRDRRYDWQSYRWSNRDFFRQDRYYAPYGYTYGYRRFSIGITIGAPFFSQRYWIDQPYDYRLPDAYPPYRWVRYYNDVLLVDTRSGYVVDVINDFFW